MQTAAPAHVPRQSLPRQPLPRRLAQTLCLAGVVLFAAACSGGSEGGTAAAGTDGSVVTESGQSASAVVDSTVVSDVPTTAPAVAAADGGDQCLQGTWTADAQLIQEFMDTIGSPVRFDVGPSSVWNLTFEGDQITGSNAISLSLRINESFITVSGATQMAGTFDADSGVLDAEFTTNVTEYSDWSAEIGGQPVPLAAAPAAPPPVGPEFVGAAYTCTTDLLTVSPSGGIGPALYRRA